MKNYNEFLTEVKKGILTFVPNNRDLEVKINKVTKTNDIVLDGLSIIKTDVNLYISPVIYLNGFYTEYQEGKSFNEILKEIANLYLKSKDNKPSFHPNLYNRENIIVNVINKKMNEELLKNTPCLEFQDLAVVFRYLANKENDGIGTVLLKDNLLNNSDLEELFREAISNTRKLLGISVRTMKEVISDILRREGCPEEMIELMVDDYGESPMYVISNTMGINGSSAILMNDVWSELSDKLDSDLYILPSSIHELIAIPTYAGKPQELKEMVESVNDGQVAINERLSDNIYIYRRATNHIELC